MRPAAGNEQPVLEAALGAQLSATQAPLTGHHVQRPADQEFFTVAQRVA
jgi:hypothetical protein